MGQLDRVKEARRVAVDAALSRWQERSGQRQQNRADILSKGAGNADSSGRVARMQAREAGFRNAAELRARGLLPLGIERKMGATLDLNALAPSEVARKAGRPVARLVQMPDPGVQPEGFATGFLVSPRLLITNHHVFPSRADAVGMGANFLYERDERGIRQGIIFELDPDALYFSNETLDYAIVAIKPNPEGNPSLDSLGFLALIEATPKILLGEPVQISEYPEGGPKQYATTDNRLVDILDTGFLQYDTDTLQGASGSPALSKNWELVALHHASIPEMRDGKSLPSTAVFGPRTTATRRCTGSPMKGCGSVPL
jgi:endonuclease G